MKYKVLKNPIGTVCIHSFHGELGHTDEEIAQIMLDDHGFDLKIISQNWVRISGHYADVKLYITDYYTEMDPDAVEIIRLQEILDMYGIEGRE